ncbi:restriction endonuclease subunit S [Mycoplasma bovis]|nr:restriction endonuclease subunit S [Mycoplasmopsis bovis]
MSNKLLVPQIRFKEFTNAWEQEKLGNLTILNRFPQISAQRLWELNQYFGEVFLLPSSDNNNWKCKYSKEIANLINTGEVITIGRARNPNVKYVNGAFISSQNHIIESKTTDALLNKFLYLFITKVGKKFYGFESTYPMFTKIDFLNTKFSFPIVSEQIKIIKTIDILDFLITLHQRKLLSLKNLKSRLLDRMFCDEKSQFPSIRFKEFTNTWEQWKVGDLITERIEFTKESNEFPLMAFVANEGVVAKGERYDRSSLVRDIYNKIYKVTKYGDFIYSSNNLDRGSIGANKYGNACISPVYSIFKCTNSSDHNFIKNILSRHSFVNKLLKYRQGVVYGQLKIHESIFLNINLNSPSILEQNKIGKIFYNLDSLITLHQRKLNSLKNIKNTLLNKMFV